MTKRNDQKNFSKNRALIIDVLNENHSMHLTTVDIHTLLLEKDSSIGIATVYRNLKYLEDNAYIHRAYVDDNLAARYEIKNNAHVHSHHHLICKSCGGVFNFENDLLDAIEKIIDISTGFEVDDHNLAFYGNCKECKRSE